MMFLNYLTIQSRDNMGNFMLPQRSTRKKVQRIQVYAKIPPNCKNMYFYIECKAEVLVGDKSPKRIELISVTPQIKRL